MTATGSDDVIDQMDGHMGSIPPNNQTAWPSRCGTFNFNRRKHFRIYRGDSALASCGGVSAN